MCFCTFGNYKLRNLNMKKVLKLAFIIGVFAALASCSGHEKCPTYNGKLEVEQPQNV